MNKLDYFKKEITLIRDKNIRAFTEKAIESLPDYFFEIPASSSKKYHPKYAQGEGGLVRHTRGAVGIAIELFKLDWWKFSSLQQDMIITSLILHDGYKSGVVKQKYTVAQHPILAVREFSKNEDLKSMIEQWQFDFIMDNIATHMGQWVHDYQTRKQVLSRPESKYQKFVHLCDYLASRKCLEFDFDAEIKRE